MAYKLVDGEHYSWSDDRTLLALTSEVHAAMEHLMETGTWPFVSEMAKWDGNTPNSGVIIFAENLNMTQVDIVTKIQKKLG